MKTIHHSFPIDSQSPLNSVLVLFAVFFATYLVGQITEKRRNYFSPAFSALISFAEASIARAPPGWIDYSNQTEFSMKNKNQK
ncbi:hypothetical protein WG899_22085 [Paucibacter sp. AS339]|uniref:hypothetical protein n=1 Tax=Paucibacter hankyongi TaxID=3133434 RepID=UPI0030A60B5A